VIAIAATTTIGYYAHRIWEQCHLTGTLDSDCESTLVLRACASHTTRLDLATVSRVLTEKLDIFIVDVVHSILAELTIFTVLLALIILRLVL
jgi:hypothetical protein